MKKRLPIAIILITSGLLIMASLMTNRIQRACYDHGEFTTLAESPEKLAWTTTEIPGTENQQTVYAGIYASTGTLLAINIINFMLLSGTVLWLLPKQKQTSKIQDSRKLVMTQPEMGKLNN